MSKIAILTDSGSGFNLEDTQRLGSYLVPLMVHLDDQSYQDGVEIQVEDILQALKDKKVPKTSTPLFKHIGDVIVKIKEDGCEEIIALPLSSGLSSTYQSIRLAASEHEINCHIIETHSTCMLQTHFVNVAKRLMDNDLSALEIVERLQAIADQADTLILPNDLDYLKQGGRLTPLAASLANMFKIKPVLQLNKSSQGRIDVLAKVRTERKALEYVLDALTNKLNDNVHVYLIHSDALTRVLEAKALLLSRGVQETQISIHHIAPVISSHTGLDCIGIQVVENGNV